MILATRAIIHSLYCWCDILGAWAHGKRRGKRAVGKVECRLQWGRGNKSNVHGNDLSNNCMNRLHLTIATCITEKCFIWPCVSSLLLTFSSLCKIVFYYKYLPIFLLQGCAGLLFSSPPSAALRVVHYVHPMANIYLSCSNTMETSSLPLPPLH